MTALPGIINRTVELGETVSSGALAEAAVLVINIGPESIIGKDVSKDKVSEITGSILLSPGVALK